MRHLRVDGHDEFNAVWRALRGLERMEVAATPIEREAAQRVRERLEATPDVPALDLDEAMLLAPPLDRCEARVPDLSGTSRSGTLACGVRLVEPGGRCPAVEHHAGT